MDINFWDHGPYTKKLKTLHEYGPHSNATMADTAFITSSGVYEFARLFFGLIRASLYFQEIMATVVLVGLI